MLLIPQSWRYDLTEGGRKGLPCLTAAFLPLSPLLFFLAWKSFPRPFSPGGNFLGLPAVFAALWLQVPVLDFLALFLLCKRKILELRNPLSRKPLATQEKSAWTFQAEQRLMVPDGVPSARSRHYKRWLTKERKIQWFKTFTGIIPVYQGKKTYHDAISV